MNFWIYIFLKFMTRKANTRRHSNSGICNFIHLDNDNVIASIWKFKLNWSGIWFIIENDKIDYCDMHVRKLFQLMHILYINLITYNL